MRPVFGFDENNARCEAQANFSDRRRKWVQQTDQIVPEDEPKKVVRWQCQVVVNQEKVVA